MNACLSCRHFNEDHTADNISDIMKDILSEWGVNINEISCATTDNGSNILKSVKDLNLPHLTCFAHNINIGVNNALNIMEVKRAVARLKCLQSSIAHSWKMKRDLHKAQTDLHLEPMSLPSACPTRWWSTVKLCHRFIDNQLALCKMLMLYSNKKHLMLEGAEVCALEDFVSATTLLEDMTKTLSGSNYITASSVLPLYAKIKRDLQPVVGERHLLTRIKSAIFAPLEEKYRPDTPMASILGLATLCDPRFRLRFLENPEDVKHSAIIKMTELEPSHSAPIEIERSPKPKRGLEKFLDFDDDEEENTSTFALPTKRAEKELRDYLAMPKVGCNECPLLWWKKHHASFPLLRVIARKHLAIPGTSVPSERVFSSGGLVLTKQRSSLKPKNAEMQIFLAQNKELI